MKPLKSSFFSQSTQTKVKQHWSQLSPAAQKLIKNLDNSAIEHQQQAVKHIARKP